MTPGEVHVLGPQNRKENTKGWSVRTVPNLYPALGYSESSPKDDSTIPRQSTQIPGRHEVIIESPLHKISLAQLDISEVEKVISVYRSRLEALKEEPELPYGVIFKNSGYKSGATIDHVHSQLLGLPYIPGRILAELKRTRDYYSENNQCLLCSEFGADSDYESRVVEKNGHFYAVCPYASIMPFHARIIPSGHESRFENIPDSDTADLAEILHSIVTRLTKCIKNLSYNLYIRTAPFNMQTDSYFHWYIDILPRTGQIGGFELASGSYINHLFPETACEMLKKAR